MGIATKRHNRYKILCLLCLFVAIPPAVSQTAGEQVGVRVIAVRTEAEAASLLRQIQSGESFEAIARAHSKDPSSKDGGYLGPLRLTDLNAALQRALIGLTPGQISPVTPISGEFFLLQRLPLEEVHWIASYNAGLEAFENARYEDAARNFLQALPDAEKLTPVDHRLSDTLHGLAEAHRLLKKHDEAEPFYRRYLALDWGGPGATAVAEVLDRFSGLLALSYFQDTQFAEARRKFHEAVDRAPLDEALYTAMSTILFKAQLMTEAETLMERAVELFPTSRDARYRLAELYRSGLKPKKALEVFEQISRMKAPAGVGPAAERVQQSVVFQKIGSIHVEAVQLDEAAAAYKTALELTPDSVDARLGLGDVYLQQGRAEDALTEYNRALAMDAKSAPAYFRVADANLRMGRFPEASAAAERVLALDGAHRKAHYVLATALVRMGTQEEGGRQLEVYRKLEAEARSETDSARNIVVMNRAAAARLLEGRAEEAVAMFRMAIETFPHSPAAYLNLGTAQSKLGQHKAAAETFQNMLTSNIADHFLVSWNLAQEYQYLGDVEGSRRHRIVYLQNIDVALREALESNLE
jgi:tetratricopeptide (TPR) repeat protein